MGWMQILEETIEIAKARIARVLKSLDDPSARVDLAFNEYREAVQMLKRAVVLMKSKIIQIDDSKAKVQKREDEARWKARNELAKGDKDTAAIYASNVAYCEKTLEEWNRVEDGLQQRLKLLEKDVIRADATMDAIEVRIDIEKMRLTVAEAEIKVGQELTGIKEHGTSLYQALNNLSAMREDREASAQALRELQEAGMLPSVAEKLMGPDMGRTDQIMKELEGEIMKAQKGGDPEISGAPGGV